MKVNMPNKLNLLPESFKNLIGLASLTIIIFFTFYILNIFYGPDKNSELKTVEQKMLKKLYLLN